MLPLKGYRLRAVFLSVCSPIHFFKFILMGVPIGSGGASAREKFQW